MTAYGSGAYGAGVYGGGIDLSVLPGYAIYLYAPTGGQAVLVPTSPQSGSAVSTLSISQGGMAHVSTGAPAIFGVAVFGMMTFGPPVPITGAAVSQSAPSPGIAVGV